MFVPLAPDEGEAPNLRVKMRCVLTRGGRVGLRVHMVRGCVWSGGKAWHGTVRCSVMHRYGAVSVSGDLQAQHSDPEELNEAKQSLLRLGNTPHDHLTTGGRSGSTAWNVNTNSS